MSGIYIPGMEMPTGNDVFTIAIGSDGRLYSIYFSDGKLGINSLHKNVIPVPEHGRLGDLDAAVEKLKRLREYHSDDSQSGTWIAHGISHCIEVLTGKEAPTIIPAEGGLRLSGAVRSGGTAQLRGGIGWISSAVQREGKA